MAGKCPNCGYCKHCGRSNPTPYHPWPWYPNWPYWNYPTYGTISVSGGSSTIGGSQTGHVAPSTQYLSSSSGVSTFRAR